MYYLCVWAAAIWHMILFHTNMKIRHTTTTTTTNTTNNNNCRLGDESKCLPASQDGAAQHPDKTTKPKSFTAVAFDVICERAV